MTRIQFKTKILYAGKFMQDYNIFHLYKDDVYINRTRPDDHPYRLAYACSQAFYPIVLICDGEGRIFGARNDLIKERWKKIKPIVEREFIGEFAERYITMTDRNVNDSTKILNLVKKDLFFSIFFSVSYPQRSDSSKEVEVFLPLVAFQGLLKGKGKQSWEYNFEEEKRYITQHIAIDNNMFFNYETILQTKEDEGIGILKGNIELKCGIDEMELLDSIFFSSNFFKEDDTLLMNIKMESYHLSDIVHTPILDKDTIKIGDKMLRAKKRNNKRTLWEQFNDYLNSPI